MPIRYKLTEIDRSGLPRSLYFNRKARYQWDTWLPFEVHYRKGLAHRPGWHVLFQPYAPHIKMKGSRVWVEVETRGKETVYSRPASQGGLWVLAEEIRFIREVPPDEVLRLNQEAGVLW